jgi:purine-binding chemotaxis protein CheW
LLVIGLADDDYAVSLDEVASLHADRKVVPVPSPRAELLGLVGVRGSVVPVYDLRQLLGYSRTATPRWLLVVRARAPFAVAFERLEAHLRLPRANLLEAPATRASARVFTRGSVETTTGPLPLLDLKELFRVVTGRRDQPPTSEETR